ncbi:ribonuclease P protein component [candidate division KSB1 bacterium]|nr:ribonuclease P protein component [candidate division KSB1 bacterium]
MKKFTLPKSIIIKKNEEFNEIFKKGKIFSSAYFIAYTLNNDSVKVGFTTPKTIKNKPQRNKIKRITRELWRKNYRNYILNRKIIIISKISLLSVNYIELEDDFNKLLFQIDKNTRS